MEKQPPLNPDQATVDAQIAGLEQQFQGFDMDQAAVDAQVAGLETQFTADSAEAQAPVIATSKELGPDGTLELSESEVAVDSLKGAVSFTQRIYSNGAKHVYGKTEDGKSVHLSHDAVLAAYGHAGDTQGKRPAEAVTTVAEADTDDPQEFFNTWGMTPQEFDALPKDQQVQVLAGRNSALTGNAAASAENTSQPDASPDMERPQDVDEAFWSMLPDATKQAWNKDQIESGQKDHLLQEFAGFWKELPADIQQQWNEDGVDGTQKADLFNAYLTQRYAPTAAEAEPAAETRAEAIAKREKKLWSIVNNPDADTIDQINAQAELVRLSEPAERRRYEVESGETEAEQETARMKAIDELVRSREAVVWSTGASSDPEGDKLRQDQQITALLGMTPKEFDRFIFPMYKSEDDPAVVTALKNELLLRSLGHDLDRVEKVLADPSISSENRAAAEQELQELQAEHYDAVEAELVLLPRKRRVGRSLARAILGRRNK